MIKRILTYIILFGLLSGSTFAQHDKPGYAVNIIPDSLRKSANAVVRSDELVFDISSIGKAAMHEKYVITILKKSGLRLSYFVQSYDKFTRISNLKGTVYDAAGKVVKKIKQDDIRDISLTGGSSLYVDNRLKVIEPEYYKYPFTIEYSYDIIFQGLLNYPDWDIFPAHNVSVEYSSYVLKKPEELKVRFKKINIDIDPVKSSEKDKEVLKWEVKGLKALKKESFSEPVSEYAPSVKLAPVDFMIDGYKGNCETWNNFGKWIYTLGEDKDILPKETQIKISNLVEGIESDYEKSKVLYEYLQDNTRYVNITVGIGGWQPIDAKTVDKVSYGDCKALTNYMKALLNTIGIKSYYTLVKAGIDASEIINDFPSNQFNHAILCALIDADTVWLECTNQRIPFGYIGSFTDDRDALLIDEQGGTLVKTKRYSENDNQKLCVADITLDENGNSWVSVSTQYKGYYYDRNMDKLLEDEQDKKKLIRERLHLPNFTLEDFKLREDQDVIPSIYEDLELGLNGYGTKFGDKISITLNMFNKVTKIPTEKQYERKSDIVFRRSLMEKDSLIFKIPAGYRVDKLSSERTITSEFGEMKTFIDNQDSLVSFVRILTIRKGDYPPESFNNFVKFYREIKKADSDRMILVKE